MKTECTTSKDEDEFSEDGSSSVRLLGVRVHNPSLEYFLSALRERISEKRRMGESDWGVQHENNTPARPLHVGFANAHCLNVAWNDPAYRTCLEQMDWVLPDGVGLRMGCRLSSQPPVRNLNGTDLFPILCELGQTEGWTFHLLGGEPGIPERMAEHMRERYPRLEVRGWHHGFFTADEEPDLIESIREGKPDLLLVALGVPRQDIWIAKNFGSLPVGAAFGVGGLFDFVSGKRGRAPSWIRRIGLEWAYRMALEPQRLTKRYILGNPVFLYRAWRWKTEPRIEDLS